MCVCVCVSRHQSQEHRWCGVLTALPGRVTPLKLLHVTHFSAPYPSGGSHYPSLLPYACSWCDLMCLPQLRENSISSLSLKHVLINIYLYIELTRLCNHLSVSVCESPLVWRSSLTSCISWCDRPQVA